MAALGAAALVLGPLAPPPFRIRWQRALREESQRKDTLWTR